jgi:hypothetical protein
MVKTALIIIGILLSMSLSVDAEDKGIIARVYKDNLPVIYMFVNELHERKVRAQLTWLMVLS